MPNSSTGYKCPCVKYTKMQFYRFFVPKTVDRPNMRCYTLPINLRNESIEARFARVCLPVRNGKSGSQKGYAAEVSEGLPDSDAGSSDKIRRTVTNSCEALSMVIRSVLLCICPYFHGPLCRRSIFYPDRRGKNPE